MNKYPDTEAFEGFLSALRGEFRSESEAADVCTYVIKNHRGDDPPTPRQVLQLLQEFREANYVPEEPSLCPQCQGTSFRLIEVQGPQKGMRYRKAIPCDCMTHEKLLKHQGWVNKVSARSAFVWIVILWAVWKYGSF